MNTDRIVRRFLATQHQARPKPTPPKHRAPVPERKKKVVRLPCLTENDRGYFQVLDDVSPDGRVEATLSHQGDKFRISIWGDDDIGMATDVLDPDAARKVWTELQKQPVSKKRCLELGLRQQ